MSAKARLVGLDQAHLPDRRGGLQLVDGVRPPLPAIGGSEAAGTVDAIGEGVTNVKVGDRVAGFALGTWCEYFVTMAAGLVPLPEAISDDVGCQLAAMPISALALLDTYAVQPPDWIVQNAANGPVRIEGRLGRVWRFEPMRMVEQAGVKELYELWLYNDQYGKSNTAVLMTTALPPGIKPAQKVQGDVPVAFVGYFFKWYAYESPDAKQKQKRLAPLLIGRVVFNKPKPGAEPPKQGRVRVLPAAGPRDAGLSISGSF